MSRWAKRPIEAALIGSKEVVFTIPSMTISLAAVFIPVVFMGGIVGKLLHEFAVTIVIAVLVSGVVSMTLTPMLCSRMIKSAKDEHAKRHNWFYRDERERLSGACSAVMKKACAGACAIGVVIFACSS